MANEINIINGDYGLTLIAKIMSGDTQIGSDISLVESIVRNGYYSGNSPNVIADGRYLIIIQTSAGIIKGFGEMSFVNNKEVTLQQLGELNAIAGLQVGVPAVNTPTSRVAGTVSVDVAAYGTNNVTVTRN